MAPAEERQEGIYTLVGFGIDVDRWRRRWFSKSMPRIQCRDQCVLVQAMRLLPYYATVCASCYANSMRNNYACVLDAEALRENDVAVVACTSEGHPLGHLRSWNVGGCDVMEPPFMVLEHREEDFQYQSSRYLTEV
ncbi:hypothetical protein V5799_002683 [Amblyomma americanum]|uniref:Uncharacterized protein n=1 Tax=Amblyomma americanum TaxID=6943 RepID=A0AAQ4DB45_AMBAM